MPVALPTSLPAPAFDGNAQAEADIAETCEFEAGEGRRAPIYRSVPNIVRWSWMLTQAEFDDYADCFEDDLQAGALSFDLPIAEQGGTHSTQTIEALFAEPPTETQIAPDVWRVECAAVTGVGINGEAVDEGSTSLRYSWYVDSGPYFDTPEEVCIWASSPTIFPGYPGVPGQYELRLAPDGYCRAFYGIGDAYVAPYVSEG